MLLPFNPRSGFENQRANGEIAVVDFLGAKLLEACTVTSFAFERQYHLEWAASSTPSTAQWSMLSNRVLWIA